MFGLFKKASIDNSSEFELASSKPLLSNEYYTELKEVKASQAYDSETHFLSELDFQFDTLNRAVRTLQKDKDLIKDTKKYLIFEKAIPKSCMLTHFIKYPSEHSIIHTFHQLYDQLSNSRSKINDCLANPEKMINPIRQKEYKKFVAKYKDFLKTHKKLFEAYDEYRKEETYKYGDFFVSAPIANKL